MSERWSRCLVIEWNGQLMQEDERGRLEPVVEFEVGTYEADLDDRFEDGFVRARERDLGGR